MEYVLYCHTTPNGKKYIGVTSTSVERRWRSGAGYKGCPAFYHAINKYGWDNISHEIILRGLTREEADKKEKEYILRFNTMVPNGYNLESGGSLNKEISEETREKLRKSHTNPSAKTRAKISAATKGRKCSDETRARMSKAFKGRKLSEEARKHISESKKGKRYTLEHCAQMSKSFSGSKNPMYGKHFSPESKEKIAETKRGARNAKAKRIICVSDGLHFDCIVDACKHYGMSKSGIGMVCEGKRNRCKGLVFAYD